MVNRVFNRPQSKDWHMKALPVLLLSLVWGLVSSCTVTSCADMLTLAIPMSRVWLRCASFPKVCGCGGRSSTSRTEGTA